MLKFLTAAALLLVAGTAAEAGTLAGGAAYGGPTETEATCYVTSFGAATTITVAAIRSQAGKVITNISTCSGTLGTNQTCAMGATLVSGDDAISCFVSVAGPATALRGTLDLRNSSATVLVSTPLR